MSMKIQLNLDMRQCFYISHHDHIWQDILRATGVVVEAPFISIWNHPMGNSVTLHGPQDKFTEAISLVSAPSPALSPSHFTLPSTPQLYEKANNVVEELHTPRTLRYFIKREKVKEKITQDLPEVHIKLYSNKIEVDGPPHQVQQAKKAIEDWVSR